MSKVTIDDISRATGYSRGTVSRALNNRSDIGAATREKILAECRRMNYSPNHAARSLATGRYRTLMVITDDLHSAFAADFLTGIVRRGEEREHTITTVALHGSTNHRIDTLRRFQNERLDALLVSATLSCDLADPVRELAGRRPIVALDTIDDIECDVLAPSQRECGRLAARYLTGSMDGNLLYFHNRADPRASERLAGFSEVCAQNGLNTRDFVREVTPGCDADCLAATIGDLKHATRIAASCDMLALQVMLALACIGRSPGADVAVIGQGNERFSERVWPGLSSIDLNGFEIGRRAVDVALSRLDEQRLDAPELVDVAPRLIKRASSACLRS